MYLDALDPVRTSKSQLDEATCQSFRVQGESILLKTLLEGARPIVTQTQIMDSLVIHTILEDDVMKNHFLQLIDHGHIQIARYPNLKAKNVQGLQAYFLSTLQKGLKDGESFHNYSAFPFLEELSLDERRKFQQDIIDAVSNQHFSFKSDYVKAEHIEQLEAYLRNLHQFDWTLRGRFTEMGPFTKGFDDLFLKGYHTLKSHEHENEEVVALCQEMMAHRTFQNTRSIYYHALDAISPHYSIESKKMVKGLIDMCYNESIASTLPDNKYNMSFETGAEELILCLEGKQEPLHKEGVLLIPSKDKDYFTWESLADLLVEVENLQLTKKITRLEALEEYKRQNSIRKPALKLAKYAALGLAPSLIPLGTGIVEIVTTGLNLIAGDMISEKLKKPSQKEVIHEFQKYREKQKVAEKAISFTSVSN